MLSVRGIQKCISLCYPGTGAHVSRATLRVAVGVRARGAEDAARGGRASLRLVRRAPVHGQGSATAPGYAVTPLRTYGIATT